MYKQLSLDISTYTFTRILGPPKAGHNNERKTLIRMNVRILKIGFRYLIENTSLKICVGVGGVFCITN